MVKEIKTGNAEKCGGQSWGRRGLVERRKEQTERSRVGDAEYVALRKAIWKLFPRDQVSASSNLGLNMPNF